MNPRAKRRVLIASAAVMGIAAPVAFSAQQGVTTNNACAQTGENGSCCPQNNSICSLDGHEHGNYYFLATGPCV